MRQIDYSVVVPVFNSEETLEELFIRIKKGFEGLNKSFEIVFVDDGSHDLSWEILSKLKQQHKELITAIKLNMNYGQHNATFCGFNYAKGNSIITIDDDLQNPPEEIKKLIAASQENSSDIVYGIYKKKQHSRARNLGSNALNISSKRLWNRQGKGSSFRLIKKHIIDKLLSLHQNFIFIDEVLNWYTDNISYIYVAHKKRTSNKSGYSSRKLWKLISNIIIHYTNIPLKLMVYGGLISSLVFFLISIYYIILKLVFDVPLGYTSIIVGISFSTSLILFALGIIGEYMSRIYMIQNKKPPYSIQKIL
jgi:glycosyltransferase involved in cell wall biosynthesis